jgi:hypothetical protein
MNLWGIYQLYKEQLNNKETIINNCEAMSEKTFNDINKYITKHEYIHEIRKYVKYNFSPQKPDKIKKNYIGILFINLIKIKKNYTSRNIRIII